MDPSALSPRRLPQRVVVAGGPGPMLTWFLDRLAATLDVPLVPIAELTGAAEVEALAAFDGWVTTADPAAAREVLLDRADLAVLALSEEPGTLRSLVRRTVRRMRADAAPELDLAWWDLLPQTRPDLATARLVGQEAAATWLTGFDAPAS